MGAGSARPSMKLFMTPPPTLPVRGSDPSDPQRPAPIQLVIRSNKAKAAPGFVASKPPIVHLGGKNAKEGRAGETRDGLSLFSSVVHVVRSYAIYV